MIDWVHEACQSWAGKVRAMQYESGFPPRSLLGKLIDEGPGAGENRFHQHLPEVLLGEQLQVSLAVRRMKSTNAMEKPCLVVVAHYLFPGKAAGKARILEMDMPSYWRHLHSAHCYIAACVEVPRGTEVLQHQVA